MDLLQMAVEEEDEDLLYILFHDRPQERAITYDPQWPRFNLDELTDDQSWFNFRFRKEELYRLYRLLGLPDVITVTNRCTCSGLDALCMVLRRFSYPNRLSDLERFFGRPASTMSMVINETISLLYNTHAHRLRTLDNPWLGPAQLQIYADQIHAKGAPLLNCIGFVDGTVRPICRPTRHQRVCYNGHKRIHAIKFQSVVIPNGLITHLYGPLEGRRHDCALLRMSGLMEQMEARDLTDRNGLPFAIYGDPAYPIRRYLSSPFRGANLCAAEEEFNRRMSSVRQCVEWEFGNLVRNYAFLDFRKNLKVLLSPVAKYYLLGAILVNCRTCVYGNQTSQYFQLDPPTLENYLA